MTKVLTLCFLFSAAVAGGLEVDSEELAPYIDTPIEFQNYEGPLEVIQTRDEILGIGFYIGEQFTPEYGQFSYFGAYTVIHAVDPETPAGLDADIMLLSEHARVDHIDNFRLIVSGYLQRAYEYSEADAGLLAEYITIYNAVFRGELEVFEERYKPIVLEHLSEDSVGLSTLYSDWPGGTELVITLSDDARPGEIAAVSPFALLDADVREQLRSREDRGIATRKSMVEFLERMLEERIEELDREVARLERERTELSEREAELIEELRGLEDRRSMEMLSERDLERIAEIEEELEELAEREVELDERAEEVAEREEEVEELTEAVREEREAIADDTREMMEIEEELAALPEEPEEDPVEDPEDPESAWFILSESAERGSLVRVRADTGERTDDLDEFGPVWGRRFETLEQDAVVIADNDGSTRLLRVSWQDMEIVARSDHEVSRESMLVLRTDENRFYAIVRTEGEWYLGRFDRDLQLSTRSAKAVRPDSVIMFADNRVYVQGRDDRVLALDRANLEQF